MDFFGVDLLHNFANMMTISIISVVFVLLKTGALANDSTISVNHVDTVISYQQQQKHIPFDSVVAGFEKLITVSEELVGTVQEGMKKEGVIGYIQKHLDVFAPVSGFVLLYVGWLAKRERS
jgi:hypothetical protein